MPPTTDFTSVEVVGGVQITTYYRRGRRGSRPDRRITRKAPCGGVDESGAAILLGNPSAGFSEPDAASPDAIVPDAASPDAVSPGAVLQDAILPGAALSGAVLPGAVLPDAVFRLLNDVCVKDVRRSAEPSLRSRLAKSGVEDTGAVFDRLVSLGIVEREERLDALGNPTKSYVTITPYGMEVLEAAFGSVSKDPVEYLVRTLDAMLKICIRPEIRQFLLNQKRLAEENKPILLNTLDGLSIAYVSPAATPGYLKILEFFGLIGSRPAGEALDFKEVAGRLNRGRRDSVKGLEGLRTAIAAVAEVELGISLEKMGIQGADLLYWIPFRGPLQMDGHAIWGEYPALSTKDLKRASKVVTAAREIVLVENRAVLEQLSDLCAIGDGAAWLVICTEGMPKLALYDLIDKITEHDVQKCFLSWTDWDLGGLRIQDKICGYLRDRALDVSLVPHPGLRGRIIEVPDAFLNHPEPALRQMAFDVREYGAVYQEETFSIYTPESLRSLMRRP